MPAVTALTGAGTPVPSLPAAAINPDLAPMQAGIADTQPVPIPVDAWTPQVVDQAPVAEVPLARTTEQPAAEPPVARQPEAAPTAAAPHEPRREPRAPAPSAQPEPPPFTYTLPPETGLELVETRHSAPAPEPEPEQPVGSRRVRPPRPQSPDEPLQMVETRPGESPPAQ